MRLACETVVNDILPAVRSLMAKELHDKGYSQTEIAELLDLTQPAVSQYLSAARGAEVRRIERDDAAYEAVTDLVEELVTGGDADSYSQQFCEVCRVIQEHGLFEDRFDEDAAHLCVD